MRCAALCRTIARLTAALALLFAASFSDAELTLIKLTIAGHGVAAEVASTEPQREQGLMFRRMLPEDRGMLFVFPQLERHGMWMVNTYLPLSVAFVDADGTIINIEDMRPHTREVHSADRPARYALEMNRGWFKKRGIKAGAKVEGIERAAMPR